MTAVTHDLARRSQIYKEIKAEYEDFVPPKHGCVSSLIGSPLPISPLYFPLSTIAFLPPSSFFFFGRQRGWHLVLMLCSLLPPPFVCKETSPHGQRQAY
jgi:hypothetical protein